MRSLDKSDSGQLAVQGSCRTRPCDLGSGTCRGIASFKLFVIDTLLSSDIDTWPFYLVLRYVLCVS